MWRQWQSITEFYEWHDSACVVLGIPHPNRNAETGEIDESAQWTLAYTEPVVVSGDDVRAVVEDHVASLVPGGLGVPCNPPSEPEVTDDRP